MLGNARWTFWQSLVEPVSCWQGWKESALKAISHVFPDMKVIKGYFPLLSIGNISPCEHIRATGPTPHIGIVHPSFQMSFALPCLVLTEALEIGDGTLPTLRMTICYRTLHQKGVNDRLLQMFSVPNLPLGNQPWSRTDQVAPSKRLRALAPSCFCWPWGPSTWTSLHVLDVQEWVMDLGILCPFETVLLKGLPLADTGQLRLSLSRHSPACRGPLPREFLALLLRLTCF